MGSASGLHEAGDRGARLGHLLLRDLAAIGGGLRDAVAQVLVEQAERNRFEGFRRRRDLREHVDAVLVALDHLGDAADLTLDAPQALQVGVLVLGVAVHPSSSRPAEIPGRNTMPPYRAGDRTSAGAGQAAVDRRVSDTPYGYRGGMVVTEFGPLLVVLGVGTGLVLVCYAV